MPIRRKLPILVERSLGDLRSTRLEKAGAFEQETRDHLGISCSAGCASCCYHPVRISILEGILLYRYLVDRGRWTPSFRQKLLSTAGLTENLAFDVWLLSNIPCPLLDDKNRCRAYDARPFNCRAILASGDPFYCHPHRVAEGSGIVSRVAALESFHAEETALLKKHGLFHLLMVIPRAILMAERIISGELDLENVDRQFLKELRQE